MSYKLVKALLIAFPGSFTSGFSVTMEPHCSIKAVVNLLMEKPNQYDN